VYTACITFGESGMEVGLRKHVRTAIDSDGLAAPILMLNHFMH